MKDNQYEQLFTEITPNEAAVIEGGKTVVNSTFSFDSSMYVPKQSSPSFSVPDGHNVILTTTGVTGGNGVFQAKLIKDGPDFGRPTVNISRGNEVNTWARQPAGTYRIFFSDEKDGLKVSGKVKVDVVPG